MRDIQFRAWDKVKKTMYYMNDVELHTIELWELNHGQIFDFMQYTGRKDKNGKEIYEGDVVRYAIEGHIQKTPYAIKDMIEWFEKMYDTDSYYRWDIGSIEVIGNIYENPELLNAEIV